MLASDHVSTELQVVCAEDVPLPFAQATERRSVAEVEVEDAGATVDSPDARATLDVVDGIVVDD